MNTSSKTVLKFMWIYFSFILIKPVISEVVDPLENIAIDCGSIGLQTVSFDGRNWTGDVSSHNISTASPVDDAIGIPEVPYKTARLFYSKFTYIFNVTPGPKFVRFHFYPSSYSGLDPSKAFLSVTDGDQRTLLSNFSATLAADYKNVYTFFKEFIIQVQNDSLHLTFTPSSNDSDAFAFVNGIEVVSMPLRLYIKGENDVPLPLVGYPEAVIRLDDESSLETVYRINVGGDDISPKQDSGLFRTWTRDEQFIFGAAFGQQSFDFNLTVGYSSAVPSYSAPESVYQTARYMGNFNAINANYNLSWYFPVETGFKYLVRLHFCELDRSITKVNQRVFQIFINNEIAVHQADIISWSNGQGVPVYKDFIVLISQMPEMNFQDLWLELHPNTDSEVKSEYYDATLNGVEIFKVNNGRNLAGPNPPSQKELLVNTLPTSFRKSRKKSLEIIIACSLSGVVVALGIFAFCIRATRETTKKKKTRQSQSSICRNFTIREINKATNNFNEAQVIGTGGFGVVYKGHIDDPVTTVAIKRGTQESMEQGFNEFQVEISTLSLLRHHNIVSLIGYYNEERENILVYEYMPNGTLFDHLHFLSDTQKSPLSWNQRLEICAGTAQGLCYLHTGMKHPIVHRDVKTSNILLDQNWVAKVSDFGLSKMDPAKGSTQVKGSIGYLDPEYCRFRKLTEKSDVYSLGVVLLEVVSAKLVVDPDNYNEEDEDGESFAEWGLNCYERGDWDQLVDENLKGKIASSSLRMFMETTKNCLAEEGVNRPSMNEVVCSLELSLKLQMNVHSEDSNRNLTSMGNSDMSPGAEFSELMVPVGR